MKKYRNDIILVSALLLSALVITLVLNVSKEDGALVKVKVDGALYGEYPLHENAQILIKRDGHQNLIVIKDGEVYMESASCKNQVCVNQRRISYAGQSIVCLPNRVAITIESREDPEVDAVAE